LALTPSTAQAAPAFALFVIASDSDAIQTWVTAWRLSLLDGVAKANAAHSPGLAMTETSLFSLPTNRIIARM
jgi:hypothetical protein